MSRKVNRLRYRLDQREKQLGRYARTLRVLSLVQSLVQRYHMIYFAWFNAVGYGERTLIEVEPDVFILNWICDIRGHAFRWSIKLEPVIVGSLRHSSDTVALGEKLGHTAREQAHRHALELAGGKANGFGQSPPGSIIVP